MRLLSSVFICGLIFCAGASAKTTPSTLSVTYKNNGRLYKTQTMNLDTCSLELMSKGKTSKKTVAKKSCSDFKSKYAKYLRGELPETSIPMPHDHLAELTLAGAKSGHVFVRIQDKGDCEYKGKCTPAPKKPIREMFAAMDKL